MSGSGFESTPEALARAAKGINEVIGQLDGLGVSGTGDLGRGFSRLGLSGLQVGDAGLKGAFDTFCDRWSWGVRTLVEDANTIARQLGLSAGRYHDVDAEVTGGLKQLGGSFVADPHDTGEQIQGMSWGGMVRESSGADYSAASWQRAGVQMGRAWQAEGRDLLDNPGGAPAAEVAEQIARHTGPGQGG